MPFSKIETSSINVIGMYMRVLPLLIRMSPGRLPNHERAPVQASNPPPASHGPTPWSPISDLRVSMW